MKTGRGRFSLALFLMVALLVVVSGKARAASQVVPLDPGWNFVSFQVEPDDSTIEQVLSRLNVVSVWYYDSLRAMNGMTESWLCYRPDNPPFLNNLGEMHARNGYWIEMDAPGTLIISGQIPATAITCHGGYSGQNGWNAVGFFSPSRTYTVGQILGEVPSDSYSRIWAYNATAGTFVELGPSGVVEPGKAYWIEAFKDVELTPDLDVSPKVFHFGSQGENGMVQVRNRGAGPIAWRATAVTNTGGSWLGLKMILADETAPTTELTGSASLNYIPFYIIINRGGLLPGEYTGSIHIVSVDKPDFPVLVQVDMTVEPIGGDYSGIMVIEKVNGKDIPNMSSRLFASVHKDGDVLTAVINSEKSLIFPYNPVLTGGLVDANAATFTAAGILLLRENSAFNPYQELDRRIARHIWLETTADKSGTNILGGIYRETIQGLVGRPIELEGTFELHKVNATPSVPPPAPVELQGRVIDDNTTSPRPISGATVILTGAGLTKYCATSTDGAFSFSVPYSDYLLNAQASGYRSLQQSVSFADATQTFTLKLDSLQQDEPGTWVTNVKPMPTPGTCTHTSGVVLDDMIYVVGADNNSYRYSPKTNSWENLSSTPESAIGVAAINGYIYAMGPEHTYQGIPSKLPPSIITSGPEIGQWSETAPLPELLAACGSGKQLVIHNGRAYIFAGQNAQGSLRTKVYSSPINSDGTLGPWIETTSLPSEYFDQVVVQVGNYAYFITGANGSTDVYYAPFNADGSVGGWTVTAPLYPSRQEFGAVSYGNYIYASGGNSGGLRDFVMFTSVKLDGSLNAWTDTTPLPEAVQGHAMAAAKGRLYVLMPNGNTYFASINSDGTIGIWTATTSLPQPMFGYSTFESNGYLYVVGGSSKSVYFSKILTDGSLDQWQATTALPLQHASSWAGANGKYLYVVGGYDGANFLATVRYAPLEETSDSWAEKAPMPIPVSDFGYAVLNDQIYVVGGIQYPPVETPMAPGTTTVQRYTPATDTWEVDKNNGGGLAPLPEPGFSMTCGVINGRVHAIGGNGAVVSECNHFIYSPPPINQWSSGPSVPRCSTHQSAVTIGNSLYLFAWPQGNGPGQVYRYNNQENWETDGDIPFQEMCPALTAAYGGNVYVFGGEVNGQPTTSADRYIPAADDSPPSGNGISFRWTASALQIGTGVPASSLITGSGRTMTVFVGSPIIGGTTSEGYVNQTRRGYKIMWSGPLAVR